MATGDEISALDLLHEVESGREIHILDVRAPQRLSSGRVDIVDPAHFHNIRGSEVLAMADPAAAGLDAKSPLVTVCGHGVDSRKVAAFLNGRGFSARSLSGGMTAWMMAVAPRDLKTPADLDRLVQFDRFGKGALGYLLVSGDEALAIDVPRDFGPWIEAATASGARIVGVADTHAHADYISGGPVLAREMRVPYHLHRSDAVSPYDGAAARLDFEPLSDGKRLVVGRAAIEVLHTPGHTEGSVCFVAGGAVLTGDFLFVRSVGRPDLGGKTDEWAPVLWRSLQRALRRWPAEMEICPAHYSSEAERRPDRTVGGRLEEIRKINEPLKLRTEGEFLGWIRARAGSFPEGYRRIKTVNLGLEQVDRAQADELEAGRNECALG